MTFYLSVSMDGICHSEDFVLTITKLYKNIYWCISIHQIEYHAYLIPGRIRKKMYNPDDKLQLQVPRLFQ